ncbi:Uncharacterized protein APZ42_006135 [Daphnia magna]|uniref:Uncharacterized protein n=1 Tax=Daphnia magna TaxID=35525 RepID=A0A164G2L6_9CRUS|nr:Uncharacterized protein APZ42_006135 [Daphnia magna]
MTDLQTSEALDHTIELNGYCNKNNPNALFKPSTIPLHRYIDDTPIIDTIYLVSIEFRCIPNTNQE